MKKIIVALALVNLLLDATAQEVRFSKYFTAEKKYLVLPVKNGAPKRNVELWVNGANQRYFDIELADDQPDWYAYLQVDQWKGDKVELRVDKLPQSSKAFATIVQSDADSNANTYKEKYRAQFHFSPKRGWMNDPNGLTFYNGEYHFFYQHNPYGREWGNMTWGHATSKDLIYWNEIDDALHPDYGGPVFSGGGVVDSNNTSGLGKDGKMPLVLFHTGARGWGQYLSWTTDGKTFHTLDHAAVPRINKDNRDPKVIWHEPSKKWVMVFWVERGDNEQHSMQFMTSADLIHWQEASVTMGGVGNDRYLFECPEFYELAVQGNASVKKWILTGANAQYAIGAFDGTTFKPEQERLQNQHGRDFYAAQTFSNVPDGRRIEIGWWRSGTSKADMNFNHCASLPLEHKLVQTPDGLRLTRMPIKEVESLRGKKYLLGKQSLRDGGANPLKNISAELLELRTEIRVGNAKEIKFNLRGVDITFDAQAGELRIDTLKAPAKLVDGKLKLAIFVDRVGLEIFVNDGLVFVPWNTLVDDANKTLSISSKGGTANINQLDVYELKSIWDQANNN